MSLAAMSSMSLRAALYFLQSQLMPDVAFDDAMLMPMFIARLPPLSLLISPAFVTIARFSRGTPPGFHRYDVSDADAIAAAARTCWPLRY